MKASYFLRSSLVPACLALLGLGAKASPAAAQVWVDESQLKGKAPEWVDNKFYRPAPVPAQPMYIPPAYHTVVTRVWVEPVYRGVCTRVWREGGVQIIHERHWVEPRYECRPVYYLDACGCQKILRYEQICISPGRFEERSREVAMPGHWENVEHRELVTAGHWETVERQEPIIYSYGK